MKHLRLIGPLILLLIWGTLVSLGSISPLILPSPLVVGKSVFSLLLNIDGLWPDVGITFYRVLVAFLLSCILGIPLGLLMGFVPYIYRLFEFLVDFFRSIPPIALFPLFLLILGIGELSKIGVPLYGCTLVMIVNSVYGVFNVPHLRRLVGKTYGLSTGQVFWKIVLPDSLPQVFVGMRTAISLALVLTIVVEMFIGSENGLGKRIYNYHLLFDTPNMLATIIIIGSMGYSLNKGFILCEQRVVHWADK